MKARLTIANVINLILAALAFGFFVTNQVNVFGGQHLQLTGTTGKWLLTGFLAVGLIVQLIKLGVGHQHWFEASITFFLLIAHIAAELTIWYGSQVFGIALPPSLPQTIIGFYWVLGPVDLLAVFLPRELALFSGKETSDQAQARKLREVEDALLIAQAREEVIEKFAQRMSANSMPAAVASQSKPVTRECPDCHQQFESDTKRGAQNALNAHSPHCPAVKTSANGHRAAAREQG